MLEEQEIMAQFPDIGLGQSRPDFLMSVTGMPVMVVECKNEAGLIETAVSEAIEYAEQIRATGRYDVRIAVGAAGEPSTGFEVSTRFLVGGAWVPLTSGGYELTSFPSRREVELALAANSGTTTVSVPSPAEFIDAAVELSKVLRSARIEAPLRPKVIGSVVLAMYEGDIEVAQDKALDSVNAHIESAIDRARDLDAVHKERLKDTLRLSGADFNRLAPSIGRVVNLLRRLNIRSVIHTDADFLGLFYEAFLRYGYDNNALGIVFTPRHITQMCVDLVGVGPQDSVIDITCGTGGFLVSAFDKMMSEASSDAMRQKVKESIAGFDTNPTVWALALLNMFFRGDGKSHIQHDSCFNDASFALVRRKFTRGFLNPPFSQDEEPERLFVNQAMEALQPGGLLAVVVKAGMFADDDHKSWREQFLRQHTLLGVISLPEDLFYPTAAPTSILLARAHVPHQQTNRVFMGRVWNDGFTKLKGRRVHTPGEQITEVVDSYRKFERGEDCKSGLVTVISSDRLSGGAEWSPQEWLPQPTTTDVERNAEVQASTMRIFNAVGTMPALADAVIDDFGSSWQKLPPLPYGASGPVTDFFDVANGKSQGEKNYQEGESPYISSGDLDNSIIRLIDADEQEQFPDGGITVTAFGLAALQPWPFFARGNGGSSVRVLQPKFRMSVREMLWFVSQINIQRWRFFYARMAIKSRLERLTVTAPPSALVDTNATLKQRIDEFTGHLATLSELA